MGRGPEGQECVEYECVPTENAGPGGDCPDGEAKRCAEYE